jgi:23S rRNA (uracil1939-C5)-methyltransferase
MANFFKASTNNDTVGKVLSLTIDRLDLNGSGVARYHKKAVFVEAVLPGEKVKVKITEQKSKFLKAKLLTVEEENQYRVKPECTHFAKCGGCDLQHLAFTEHMNFKQKKVIELFSRNDIHHELPWYKPIASQPWHYRRKARIGVQYNKKGQATVGFRKKSTNELLPIKTCKVLVEPLSEVFTALSVLISELTLSQSVGHVEVIETEFTSIIIRQLKRLNTKDKAIWLKYAEQYNWQLFIDDGEKVIPLVESTTTKVLSYSLVDNICINFTVKDFIQVNHSVNLAMVEQAIDWLSLTSDDVVLDLFCGLGNFSLPIAKRVKHVTGIEGIQTMVDRAEKNALDNQLLNCEFYQSDLNEHWLTQSWTDPKKHNNTAKSFNKVLLDPARAGAWQACEQIVKLKVESVLYVSCDPATLARDSKHFLESGYSIERIAIMDMFAQTKHIETMVLFTRASK